MRRRTRRSCKLFAVLISGRFHSVYPERAAACKVRDQFNAMFARHNSRDVAEVVTATLTYDPANVIREGTETVAQPAMK